MNLKLFLKFNICVLTCVCVCACVDTFQVTYKTSKKDVSVGLLSTGIAWVSDKTVKFKNPSGEILSHATFTVNFCWQVLHHEQVSFFLLSLLCMQHSYV